MKISYMLHNGQCLTYECSMSHICCEDVTNIASMYFDITGELPTKVYASPNYAGQLLSGSYNYTHVGTEKPKYWITNGFGTQELVVVAKKQYLVVGQEKDAMHLVDEAFENSVLRGENNND
jgi:hypothetical protein